MDVVVKYQCVSEYVCVCESVCVFLLKTLSVSGRDWDERRRKASQIHPTKAIYVRITVPWRIRLGRCHASSYLISQAAMPWGGER